MLWRLKILAGTEKSTLYILAITIIMMILMLCLITKVPGFINDKMDEQGLRILLSGFVPFGEETGTTPTPLLSSTQWYPGLLLEYCTVGVEKCQINVQRKGSPTLSLFSCSDVLSFYQPSSTPDAQA